jgi:hypothetical protein
MFETARW